MPLPLNAVLAPGWQHPYVNVFKLVDAEHSREVEKSGEVLAAMDRIIGKPVFKIRGLIPATNFIRMPRYKSQSLGLTGRFLYIQFKVSPVKTFVVHLELVTADSCVHRVSISSMYKEHQLRRKSGGIQIPFPRASHRWCVLSMDLAGTVADFTSSPFISLRSAQLCSWMTVRSMFTTDQKFSLTNLPGEMALSHALDSSLFEQVWLPREPKDVPDAGVLPITRRGKERGTPSPPETPAPGAVPPSHTPCPVSPDQAGPLPIYRESTSAPHLTAPARAMAQELAAAAAAASLHTEPPLGSPQPTTAHQQQYLPPPPGSPVYPHSPPLQGQPSPSHALPGSPGHRPATAPMLPRSPGALGQRLSPRPGSSKGTKAPATALSHGLKPDPIMALERVNAYQGGFTRTLKWPPHSEEVVFTAGSVIVAMHACAGGRQRFFLGHTSHVVALAFDAEGMLMASAQDGKAAVIRLWDFRAGMCVAVLTGHASGMVGVDISQDGRALIGVGLDSHARQLMVLWDISQLRFGGKPEVVARHTTEYNIKAVRFSEFEEDQVVTCGRDSVRVYRLKDQQLRGVSVRLGPPDRKSVACAGGISAALGPNIFTDIAFEVTSGRFSPGEQRRLYTASASGAVFEIDYNTRTLLCVYQLHSAAINTLVMHSGFCVTASDDRQLRVWPSGFSDYLMEAEHESGVASVGVSPDGLCVAVGTESGAVGMLDIPTHQYTPLLRSHVAAINAVAADPNRHQYCTASSDGTLRVWDIDTHQQLVEFDAPGEVVTCIAYHPFHHEIAAGFENGRVRVFDVSTTSLIQEHLQHRGAVTQTVYAPDGTRMYSGGTDGGLCVYDVAQVYQPTKFLPAGARDLKVLVTVSPDGLYLATVARDPYRRLTSLLIFHGSTLEPYMRIETDTPSFKSIAFSADSSELWAVAEPNRLDRYELQEGQLLQQVTFAHRLDINALAVDPSNRFVVTVGTDGLVKAWAIMARQGSLQALQAIVPPHQAFTGHSSAVLGAAFQRGRLITVGDAEDIYIWRVSAEVEADHTSALSDSTSSHNASTLLHSPVATGFTSPHNGMGWATQATYSPVSASTHAAPPATPEGVRQWRPAEPATILQQQQQGLAPSHAGSSPVLARQVLYPPPSSSSPHGGASWLQQQPMPHFQPSMVQAPLHPQSPTPTNQPPTPQEPYQPQHQHHQHHQQQQHPHHQHQLHASPASNSPRPSSAVPPHHAAHHSFPPSTQPRPQSASPPSSPRPSTAIATAAAAGAARSPKSHMSPKNKKGEVIVGPVVVRAAAPGHAAPSPPADTQGPVHPPQCVGVVGYTPCGASENVAWAAESGLLAYAVDNLVVLEDLASHAQRLLHHHTQPIAALALSPDSKWAAAAPAAAEPSSAFAEVAVWDVETTQLVAVLSYHPIAVEALRFCPHSRLLVSVGRDPERALVVWDLAPAIAHHTAMQQQEEAVLRAPSTPPPRSHVAGGANAAPHPGLLVAVGRTRHPSTYAAWLPYPDHASEQQPPRFVTAGGDGLLLWTLLPTCLEQTSVALGPEGTFVTAVCVDPRGVVVAADTQNWVWEMWLVGDQKDNSSTAGGAVAVRQVAQVPGTEIMRLTAAEDTAAVGTLGGLVTLFSRGDGLLTWERKRAHTDSAPTDAPFPGLDGAVRALHFEPGMQEAVASTTSSSLWYLHLHQLLQVPLVCGHSGPITSISTHARGRNAASLPMPAAPKHAGATSPRPSPPPLLASTSEDGTLRLWSNIGEGSLAEPLADFQAPVGCRVCTCVPSAPHPRLSPPSAQTHARGTRPQSSTRASPRAQQPKPTGLPPCSPRSALNAGGERTNGRGAAPHTGLRVLAGYADGSLRLFAALGAGVHAAQGSTRAVGAGGLSDVGARDVRSGVDARPDQDKKVGAEHGVGAGNRHSLNKTTGAGKGLQQQQPQQQDQEGAVLLWRSARHSAPVVAVAAHPQGKLALSASSDGQVAVTDLTTSNLLVLLDRFVPGSLQQQLAEPGVDRAGLSVKGGHRAAQGSGSPNPKQPSALANLLSQQQQSQGAWSSLPLPSMDSLAVSAGDMSVCAGAWRTHMLVFSTPWEDSNVEVLALYQCGQSVGELSHDVPAIARFVPKTTKVVAYSSPLLLGKVVLFDYRLGAVTRTVSISQQVRSLAFSPDGAMLALGGMGQSVFLATDLSLNEEPVELKGHRYPVTSLTFLEGTATGGAPCLVSSGGAVLFVWSLPAAVAHKEAIMPRDSRIM